MDFPPLYSFVLSGSFIMTVLYYFLAVEKKSVEVETYLFFVTLWAEPGPCTCEQWPVPPRCVSAPLNAFG